MSTSAQPHQLTNRCSNCFTDMSMSAIIKPLLTNQLAPLLEHKKSFICQFSEAPRNTPPHDLTNKYYNNSAIQHLTHTEPDEWAKLWWLFLLKHHPHSVFLNLQFRCWRACFNLWTEGVQFRNCL